MIFFNQFHLKVDDTHSLMVYEAGKSDGIPVIYLHGGPGAYIEEKCVNFFDLNKYHVILFDQRGCGKSIPHACIKDNTTFDLVEDIEKIRKHFKLNKFNLFGGSFGSFLALIYAISYPQYISNLILRGIFLGRKEDVDWLFVEGANYFYPKEHEEYLSILGGKKDIIKTYNEYLNHTDKDLVKKSAKAWNDWENSCVTLVPQENTEDDMGNLSTSRLECHYMINNMFLPSDNYILDNIEKISHIKTYIVHGRYDVDCRPIGAWLLYKRLQNAEVFYEICGHSAFEENNFKRLKNIMDNL